MNLFGPIKDKTTYKLVWQGYPVFMVGSTDRQRAFHPFGLAICMGETGADFEFLFKVLVDSAKKVFNFDLKPNIILSDASPAIPLGFTQVFGENYAFKRVMCWVHMKRNVNILLSESRNIQFKDAITLDIRSLQLAVSLETFRVASDLFTSKLSSDCPQFVAHFRAKWLVKNFGWFEGYAMYVPSQNNALEASNRVIKSEQTFRERLPIGRMIKVIEKEMVYEWSIKRDPNTINGKIWATEVVIGLKDFTDAHQWLLLKKDIVTKTMLDRKFYFTPALSRIDLSKAEVNEHVGSRMSRSWATFEEFVLAENSIWCIDINTDNWMASQCNCPKFFKFYKCKHIIGIASRLKLCDIPMQAKTIELGTKRKRGRPALARPALIRP